MDRETCMKKDSTTIEITRTKDQNFAGKSETKEDQEIHAKMKLLEHSECSFKNKIVALQNVNHNKIILRKRTETCK